MGPNIHIPIRLLFLLLLMSACAPYSANTARIRSSLSNGDHAAAYDAVRRGAHGPSKLLYFLEAGLIAHYDGAYERSNELFDRAERIADELFTRSVTREIASLITNDETRDYRGETYELVHIHYYRALNYWYLGLREDALVECRKANLKLDRITSRAETELTYRNDAFIHYLTALFYEAEREYNDAYVSLVDARDAYRTYADRFGISAPDALHRDLARVEAELGYAARVPPGDLMRHVGLDRHTGELVVFAEIGFIPRKTQEELNLPVYDTDLRRVSGRGIGTVSRDIRRRRHRHVSGVDYWLRVAVPTLEAAPEPKRLRIVSDAGTVTPVPAQDLDGIARLTLRENEPALLGRTIARALVKLAATKGAEKKSEWLGFLVNLFTASTEKADTRSWVTLPREIRVGRLRLPPGRHTIKIQSLDRYGRVVDETLRQVTIHPGRRTFINQRHFG